MQALGTLIAVAIPLGVWALAFAFGGLLGLVAVPLVIGVIYAVCSEG